MKKIFLSMLVFLLALRGQSQHHIQGSIQQGAAANKVDIIYLPNYDNAGEYVNYLSISIAIPTSSAAGVIPTIVGVGNFASLTFLQATPFSYTQGSETIYSWACPNGTPLSMSWTDGVPFVGATITFTGTGAPASSKVRMVDFTSLGGGTNANTFFNVGVNVAPFDLTDYTNMFVALSGGTVGTYPSGDQYIESNALIVLPVRLLNFSGSRNGNKNTLHWTTASEINNKGFDVQRSGDGVTYSSIGFVNTQAINGNSSADLYYTYEDNYPTGDKAYYRLKQVDIDNHSKFSPAVLINGEAPLRLSIAGVYPNPVTTVLNVMIDAPEQDNVTLLLTDLSGRLLKQQGVNVSVGTTVVGVDVSGLAKGNYLVKLVGRLDGGVVVSKFVK